MVNRKSRNAYFLTHGSPRKRMGLYCKSIDVSNPQKEIKRKKKRKGIVIPFNQTRGFKKKSNNQVKGDKSKKKKGWKLIAVTWKDAKEYFENLEKINREQRKISA